MSSKNRLDSRIEWINESVSKIQRVDFLFLPRPAVTEREVFEISSFLVKEEETKKDP